MMPSVEPRAAAITSADPIRITFRGAAVSAVDVSPVTKCDAKRESPRDQVSNGSRSLWDEEAWSADRPKPCSSTTLELVGSATNWQQLGIG